LTYNKSAQMTQMTSPHSRHTRQASWPCWHLNCCVEVCTVRWPRRKLVTVANTGHRLL